MVCFKLALQRALGKSVIECFQKLNNDDTDRKTSQ